MKWLTLDYIHAHSRVDFDCEDSLLELYGKSAEEAVLNVTRRTYDELIEQYGEIPAPIYQACLMLVELSYTQRSPGALTNLHTDPYAFDFLVKPYMKLHDDE